MFQGKGMLIGGNINLSGTDVMSLKDTGIIVVDLREEYEYAYKQFAGVPVLQCPFTQLEELYSTLPHDKPFVVADSTGLRSKMIALWLREKGYNNVANLAGGIMDWERDGFPVEIDKSGQLSGPCLCMLKKRKQ